MMKFSWNLEFTDSLHMKNKIDLLFLTALFVLIQCNIQVGHHFQNLIRRWNNQVRERHRVFDRQTQDLIINYTFDLSHPKRLTQIDFDKTPKSQIHPNSYSTQIKH